ncbi:MAG: HDOD domain-containing protein [Calditrichaeota bacterium]|nr:MAG: HDOD domain-containing protein [Calditrichota bacterium]MBL1206047.1 HDOD domain-containing protein [Calditrichota bacterium]NOG45875.1 HDOD domain-containing protein [Calditrichota bacterium]
MDIIKIIEEAEDFPTLPNITFQLNQLMSKEDVSLHSVAKLIETDSSMVTRILKNVNSGYYKLNSPISNIYQAVSILGIRTMRDITLMVSFNKLFPQQELLPYSSLFYRSLCAGIACNFLSDITKIKNRSEAFIASLLQNLGAFVFMFYLGKDYLKIIEEAKEYGVKLALVEKNKLKITQAQAGSIIAEKWKLPQEIVLAIRYQNNLKLSFKKNFGPDFNAIVKQSYLGGIVADIFLGWNKAVKIAQFKREYGRLFHQYKSVPEAEDILHSIPHLVMGQVESMNQSMEPLLPFEQIKGNADFELELLLSKHNKLFSDFKNSESRLQTMEFAQNN